MSSDTIALVLSIVGSSSAAVWLIRSQMSVIESKMSDIELAFTKLLANESAERNKLEARIALLEAPRRRRK